MIKLDHRIHQVSRQQLLQLNPKNQQTKQINKDFKAILDSEKKLKISKHASERLHERNINISEVTWQKLNQKINEAKQKGITDSLVLMNDAALLVSAENSTVVTAMNLSEIQDRIFTNINGTIVMSDM